MKSPPVSAPSEESTEEVLLLELALLDDAVCEAADEYCVSDETADFDIPEVDIDSPCGNDPYCPSWSAALI